MERKPVSKAEFEKLEKECETVYYGAIEQCPVRIYTFKNDPDAKKSIAIRKMKSGHPNDKSGWVYCVPEEKNKIRFITLRRNPFNN